MVPGRCPPRQLGSEPALQCLRPINQGLLRQKPKSHLDQLGNIKPSTASLARMLQYRSGKPLKHRGRTKALHDRLGVSRPLRVLRSRQRLCAKYLGGRNMRPRGAFSDLITRRRLLATAATGALWSSMAKAEQLANLPLPGGPDARSITTAFPQKGSMILQRTRPPLLETPFEVFDRGTLTPNDQFYVRWHWADIPTH